MAKESIYTLNIVVKSKVSVLIRNKYAKIKCCTNISVFITMSIRLRTVNGTVPDLAIVL